MSPDYPGLRLALLTVLAGDGQPPRGLRRKCWYTGRCECAGDLGARVEVEAGQGLAEVELDGLDADVKFGCDLAAGFPGGGAGYQQLTGGQRQGREPRWCCGTHAYQAVDIDRCGI